jgi:hypothetical protein
MRSHAWTVAMVAVLVASVFAGGAGPLATTVSADEHEASVAFSGGTSGGATVVVDEVTVPEGGFVTIHDNTLTDGATLGSVVGTSAYLEPGTHENVEVRLDADIDDGTLHAMAHRDTNGDRAYTFVSSNGATDGPYTSDGNIVMNSASVTVSATVSFSGQTTDGTSVVVDRVELSEGGFVTIHDSSLLDGAVFESIRGTSAFLPAGVHENVRIELDEPLTGDETLVPMAHRDTNDNQAYDFPETEGEADGPFLSASDEAVVADAQVELGEDAMVSFDAQATGGTTVVVEDVFVPAGGFVTLHDSSLGDGAVLDSIRGTSTYLEPGLHRNVVVRLDDPLASGDALFAMAHRDTNDNQAYDFLDTEGSADGPYTSDGDIVMQRSNVTVAASVEFDRQSTDGTTVVVDQVDLSAGGFVTIHDSSLAAGAVFESVRGTSAYLEAGVHEDVVVELDEPISETRQLLAMAHRDTDDDQAYEFVTSEGEDDGPYTAGGNIVMDGGTASVTAAVSADAGASDGDTIVVDRVTLHDGGFVTVHDSSLGDGEVLGSIRGTSTYLEPGTHETVEITLDSPLDADETVFTMAHLDTNGNEAYDFLTSDGAADGPYVAAGGPVMDRIDVAVENDEMDDETTDEGSMDDENTDDGEMGDDEEMSDDEGMDDENTDEGGMDDENTDDDSMDDNGMDAEDESTDGDDTANDDGPGFGIIAAALALIAVATVGILARRRA